MIKTVAGAAALVAFAAGVNLAAVAPAGAQDVGVAGGRRCGFSSVTDPTIENGEVQTGQLNGGPLAATSPGATISMRCTIQVGAANATHNGSDSCSAVSSPTLQVTAVSPTLCSYLSPEGQPVYMCTEITINGVTYYWDNDPPGSGMWVTSSGAACAEAISQELFPGPFGPVLEIIDGILVGVFDSTLCPILAGLSPGVPGVVDILPDGDVYVLGGRVWDCPPYDEPTDLVGSEPGFVGIVDPGSGAPVFVAPPGIPCSGQQVSQSYTVTCYEAVPTRRDRPCVRVLVSVSSWGNGHGAIKGETRCGTAVVSATVTTPPPASLFRETATHQYVSSWSCTATWKGNARPWQVTCGTEWGKRRRHE